MSAKTYLSYLSISIFCYLFQQISGHGMMLDPPNRSSLWRFDPDAPINYDDDQNYCGGINMQWVIYNGECGVCGDPYGAPHPQENENTGKYGRGTVVRQYPAGSVIDVYVKLTANHKGYFNFSVCSLENPNAPEPGEGCFIPVTLENGDLRYPIFSGQKEYNLKIKLPDGLTCQRCVLRWNYQAGNNWGQCDDGSFAMGCGPQETFRSCSDIAIY